MANSDMYMLVVSLNEDLMDEAKSEASEELGYDAETEDENEQQELYAKAIISVIETHISKDVVYNFYKHTCEPEDEQIAEMSVYIKAGDKFISTNSLNDASIDDLVNIDYGMIGMYFVFDQEIEIEEDYFITLSEECGEKIDRLTYICQYNDDFLYQGYSNGDYDTGYFSNDEEECYVSTSDDFPFSEFIADKATVIGK